MLSRGLKKRKKLFFKEKWGKNERKKKCSCKFGTIYEIAVVTNIVKKWQFFYLSIGNFPFSRISICCYDNSFSSVLNSINILFISTRNKKTVGRSTLICGNIRNLIESNIKLCFKKRPTKQLLKITRFAAYMLISALTLFQHKYSLKIKKKRKQINRHLLFKY